jgi:osmotically-inducible protein OsmY
VQKGWVTLTGSLDWNYQKVGAANAIEDLEGVTGVTNKITIKPQVTSVDVRKRIEEALKRSAEVEAGDIKIDVAADKVTLKGRVKTWSERWLVEDTAWATPGVTHVSDELIVGG